MLSAHKASAGRAERAKAGRVRGASGCDIATGRPRGAPAFPRTHGDTKALENISYLLDYRKCFGRGG
jgi:hypothetical protein